jgi:hypothetical protein
MTTARLVLVAVLLLLFPGAARAADDARTLPTPYGKGALCPGVLPCGDSDSFGAHLRFTFHLQEGFAGADFAEGGSAALSFTLWRWAEAGVSVYGLLGSTPAPAAPGAAAPGAGPAPAPMNSGYRRDTGPLSLWARLSPPLVSGLLSNYLHRGVTIAAWAQLDAATPPFDANGTLYPDTQTYGLILQGQALRAQMSLYAALQGADGWAYRGIEAGGGVCLGKSLQLCAEILGRSGQHAGVPGEAFLESFLGVRWFDEKGISAGAGYHRNLSGSGRAWAGELKFGWSIGPKYPRSEGSSIFGVLGDMIRHRWEMRGFYDPIIGGDGNIYSDDGKTVLRRYGYPHPRAPHLIVPAVPGGQVLPAGSHVLLRDKDGQVLSMGEQPLGYALDPERAVDQAIDRSHAEQEHEEQLQRAALACPLCQPSPLPNYGDGRAGYALACAGLRWAKCGLSPWEDPGVTIPTPGGSGFLGGVIGRQTQAGISSAMGRGPGGGRGPLVVPAPSSATPRGSNNPNTKRWSAKGTKVHTDLPGHLPDQLRDRYDQTSMEFKKPGQPGQDVRVIGGKHPSEYPGSTWPAGVDHADFKPDTRGGQKTFRQDQKHKWKEPTHMLPYDPQTEKLR